MMPKNVLIAIDHGAISEQALEWGLKNLINKEDTITLLHVYNLEPANFYGELNKNSSM
jgi:nucleotide-binding universal stress UspA family protein